MPGSSLAKVHISLEPGVDPVADPLRQRHALGLLPELLEAVAAARLLGPAGAAR